MRKTPFGRKTLLDAPDSSSIQRGFSEGMAALVGQSGVALTDLRPSGVAEVGGVRIDVTAATAFVQKHTRIKVVLVEGTRIVVEPSLDGKESAPQ
jgi:membrane-bound serine protease (ClpP class)